VVADQAPASVVVAVKNATKYLKVDVSASPVGSTFVISLAGILGTDLTLKNRTYPLAIALQDSQGVTGLYQHWSLKVANLDPLANPDQLLGDSLESMGVGGGVYHDSGRPTGSDAGYHISAVAGPTMMNLGESGDFSVYTGDAISDYEVAAVIVSAPGSDAYWRITEFDPVSPAVKNDLGLKVLLTLNNEDLLGLGMVVLFALEDLQGQVGAYYGWKVAVTQAAADGDLDPEPDVEESSGPLMGPMEVIPAGQFLMGCTGADETQHMVVLSHRLLMKQTEVTQEEFESIMGYNPATFTNCGDTCPVETVTFYEALAYCNRWSVQELHMPCYGLTNVVCKDDTTGDTNDCQDHGGIKSATVTLTTQSAHNCNGYRLPTEAEWEYAARAGTTTAFYSGDILVQGCELDANLNPIAWYCYNSSVSWAGCDNDQTDLGCIGPSPVAQKSPNAWGLYDMSGNVWEWVWDWYGTYDTMGYMDPTGPQGGQMKVNRGGSYRSDTSSARSANRLSNPPESYMKWVGFRVVINTTLPDGDEDSEEEEAEEPEDDNLAEEDLADEDELPGSCVTPLEIPTQGDYVAQGSLLFDPESGGCSGAAGFQSTAALVFDCMLEPPGGGASVNEGWSIDSTSLGTLSSGSWVEFSAGDVGQEVTMVITHTASGKHYRVVFTLVCGESKIVISSITEIPAA